MMSGLFGAQAGADGQAGSGHRQDGGVADVGQAFGAAVRCTT